MSVKSLQKMSEDKQGGVRAAASQAEKSPQQFRLNDTAQLSVEKGDITKFEGDAIVNAGQYKLASRPIPSISLTMLWNTLASADKLKL